MPTGAAMAPAEERISTPRATPNTATGPETDPGAGQAAQDAVVAQGQGDLLAVQARGARQERRQGADGAEDQGDRTDHGGLQDGPVSTRRPTAVLRAPGWPARRRWLRSGPGSPRCSGEQSARSERSTRTR
jgi:hypothetical protein